MEGNFELLASLGSMPPKPELICKLERGDDPCASDANHSGMWDAQGTPGADDQNGISIPEVTIKQEPGVDWPRPSSPPLWGAPGPDSHPLAFCPIWCEVKLLDVRSLASDPSLEKPWGPSQEEPPVCRECRRSFADGDSLRRHPCTIHGAAAAEEKDGEKEEEKKGPFACPSCGKAFRYLSNLLTHKKHRGKRRHTCAQCGAHFCLQGDLLRHRASHTAEGAYRCGVCNLVFQHKWLLASHKAEEHLGAKGLAFHCQDCSQAFATKSELLRHHRVEHEEDQPFVCPTCGECFSWRESLQIHQQKHAPERPFRCPLCGKGFTRRNNLLTHQRLHTGELPFNCPDCGRAFPSKVSLTTHGRLHRRERPFPCSFCGRRFRLQAKLLEHQASHGPPEVKEEAKA
ncbi:gastrula zinc finger protein XlCGF52.1-like isoform X2 [Sceloporus undulatus]|nr:gastrula zinc finger protein XlCGF52.1-like isoform X2 [Sceloporus undulatus]XP_042328424.1 gastrula zinc finger protein XlCGF52.1-like isoform X2 [Sceloporus undulatus]XP_042328425.1 gastrula zinc finger protein XlCGF52.1-like isoform X2 [Sceloporus undulatus]XP_042328427.1 gastrula zinc finger protein XlCGF52.1-like isoform X2 [Sceloporus undulatus]